MNHIKIGLMIFQELLMIFTAGIKYHFSEDEKVDITKLTQENIKLMNEYFASIEPLLILMYLVLKNI